MGHQHELSETERLDQPGEAEPSVIRMEKRVAVKAWRTENGTHIACVSTPLVLRRDDLDSTRDVA